MSDGYTMKDHVRDLEKWREEDMATITNLRTQLAEAKADNARLREAAMNAFAKFEVVSDAAVSPEPWQWRELHNAMSGLDAAIAGGEGG